MHLWDRTIPQAELTLNLLRGSRINPKLSAWEQLHGRYDYTRNPIAPPGIKVLAHLKPDQRSTWAFHATPAWYIGPALEHYRCYKVWIIATRQERIVNTLTWLPTKITMPTATPEEMIEAVLQDLKTILEQPPTDTLIATLPPTKLQQLQQLIDIFQQKPTTAPQQLPAPVLRVEHEAAPAPIIRVPPIAEPEQPPVLIQRDNDNSIPTSPIRPRQSERLAQKTIPITTPPRRPTVPIITPERNYLVVSVTHLQHLANTVTHPETGQQVEYKDIVTSSQGPRWKIAMGKEIGRLFQGYQCSDAEHSTKGTDTCKFIKRHKTPRDKNPRMFESSRNTEK